MSQLFLILGLIGIFILYRIYKNLDLIEKKNGGEMDKCSKCKVNIPKSEAIKSGDRWYCCKDHKN